MLLINVEIALNRIERSGRYFISRLDVLRFK